MAPNMSYENVTALLFMAEHLILDELSSVPLKLA
jgi:hypothetical protein